MSNKLDPDFLKADSGNLPKVNIFMVLNYIKNDDNFNDPEVRNAKMNESSRENYGDAAMGYVCLKRDGALCILKASICPEHKVRDTPYKVTLIVNEKSNTVNTVECEDCPASLGGCKHAIALLMWVNRRTEEPAPTEVKCYWKKSNLAKVTTTNKYVAAVDLFEVTEIAQKKNIDSQITRHLFDINSNNHIKAVSLHQLMILFNEMKMNEADEFLKFAEKKIEKLMIVEVEKATKSQSDDPLWYECRYGRITASLIYEAAHCRTADGSLVKKIIGAAKVFLSQAMQRGKDLEKQVLLKVKKKKNISCRSCGLYLLSSCPVIGASPDAVGSDFIVEIKCPSSTDNIKTYLSKGVISEKCKAQMFTQMLCANKRKGLFCVADPLFEQNKKVTTVWLTYDDKFTGTIEKATEFWKKYIFPRLMTSVS
ncbi:uncharacterized protein LOC131663353 [Phymastichus coffea]|uniref:uncharacterized protein LOC131663353 n=1 Tax=Phymastichus coffea TaxID=108790 RepID=UPI00273B22AE|nr:uncharacterized protein LOC131663353 [Phymastichus coffea]